MKKTITFAKESQKILWENELLGQLSDGYWENTRPNDHWVCWHHAEAKVGESIGINFCPRKNNYNFAAKKLVGCVGQRMINSVRLTKAGFGSVAHHKFEDILWGEEYTLERVTEQLANMKSSSDKYFIKKFQLFIDTFGDGEEGIQKYFSIVTDESLYNKNELLFDLIAIEATIKTRDNSVELVY